MRTIKVIIGVACLIAAVLNWLFALGGPYFWLPFVICATVFALTGCYLIAKRSSQLSTGARCFVSASLFLLATFVFLFVIPRFVEAHYTRAENACINNLRQIEGAKEQWALENRKTNGVVTVEDIRPYLGRGPAGSFPICPAGGTYVVGSIGEDPQCTIGYSAWPNVHVLNPTNSWWSGVKSGYAVLFGLGHVEKP